MLRDLVDRIKNWIGRGRAASPEDLVRRPGDDEPGAEGGLERPFPDAP